MIPRRFQCGFIFFFALIFNVECANFGVPIPVEGKWDNTFGMTNLIVADMNGDSREDIVLSGGRYKVLQLFERQACLDPFYIQKEIPSPVFVGNPLVAGDLDSDGDVDLLTPTYGTTNSLVWLENRNGNGIEFTTHTIHSGGHYQGVHRIVDLDGDGDSDIVSSSEISANLCWFENRGGSPPAFIHHDFGVNGIQLPRLIVNDFDQDGDQDIVYLLDVQAETIPPSSTSERTAKLILLENNGQRPPQFTSTLLYQLPFHPCYDFALADLDGNGNMDVALNVENRELRWLKRSGTYSFLSETIDNVGDQEAYRIQVADADHDGDNDLFILDTHEATIWLYENKPEASVRFSKSVFAKNGNPYEMAFRDLDKDGDLDVIARFGGQQGSFGSLFWFKNLTKFPQRLEVLALDGVEGQGYEEGVFLPSKLRFKLINHTPATVDWITSVSTQWLSHAVSGGQIGPEQTESLELDPAQLAAGLSSGVYSGHLTFRQQGVLDSIAEFPIVMTIKSSIWSKMNQTQIGEVDYYAGDLWVADLNADGFLDCFAIGQRAVYGFLGDGNLNFNLEQPKFVASRVLAKGDLDHNGIDDLVMSGSYFSSFPLVWQESLGGSPPVFKEHLIADKSDWRTAVCADFNGDGRLDILAQSSAGLTCFLNIGNNQPIFTPINIGYESEAGVSKLEAADFDHDGDLDLAVHRYFSGINIYENLGGAQPEFVPRLQLPNAWGMAIADLDSDGFPDIVASQQFQTMPSRIVYYRNNGKGPLTQDRFSTRTIDSTILGPYDLRACDFDLDGDLDLFVFSFDPYHSLYYLENLGGESPEFAASQITTGFELFDLEIADFDRDGDLELVLVNDQRILLYHISGLAGPVVVLSPNGGENLKGGAYTDIEWKTELQTAGSAVRLELRNSSGWVADLGYSYDPDGNGRQTVYCPLVPASSDYRIRAISSWNPLLQDDSNMPFHISGGAARLELPNGGEQWIAGEVQKIFWQMNPLFGGTAIRAELWDDHFKSADLGLDWEPGGEGFMDVIVPSVHPGNNYRVKVISLWDENITDDSDRPFFIINSTYGKTSISPVFWELYQ